MLHAIRAVTTRAAAWPLGEYLQSAVAAATERGQCDHIERFCFFAGYPRSGHSLIGALLNAHPDMVISHELNALRYVDVGFSRAQLQSLILKRDREFVEAGCVWTGYDYSMPGQWQGKSREIRVIGDKTGGGSSKRIVRNPSVLRRLERMYDGRLALINVLRNPYDNIATMYRRAPEHRTLGGYIRQYFDKYSAGTAMALEHLGPDRSITMRHEDIVDDPHGKMRRLCEFLGQDASEDFLDACAAKIFPSPKKSRLSVEWSPENLDAVQRGIDQYPFLQGYTFEN